MNEKKIRAFFTKKLGKKSGVAITEIILSVIATAWIALFTFPIIVIQVNTVEKSITWRWDRLGALIIAVFLLSFVWRYLLRRRELGNTTNEKNSEKLKVAERLSHFQQHKLYTPTLVGIFLLTVAFPIFASLYQTTVMSTALIYVMLGLGLNIVVGLGGLLNLGYVAFYAVGAYTYALLHMHFGIGFWIALPVAAVVTTIVGTLLALPVLRLRGDYLAIVTLAFAEIIRLVLENEGVITGGPSGVRNIPAPEIFNIHLKLPQRAMLTYYIILGVTILTVFVIYRLENSRIGRALQALREDEIASRAMGIDTSKMKLISFSLGATWAGLGGVLFASKTTFINPASFTIWESIVILCFVVLGGMGSIFGVALAAILLTILPESLRAFSEYRMIVYGSMLVLMMIFRPGGIIDFKKKHYKIKPDSKKRNESEVQNG